MAITANAQWEYRAGGNNNNGGGFDSTISGAGTDYSLQDSAELPLTDIACTSNSTIITSVTGGFTSAMIGNVLNLYTADGAGNAVGFYFIMGVTNTNTATIDRVIGTTNNMTSGDGNIGGALLSFLDAHLEQFVGGNKVWVKGDYSMTITASITLASSSPTITAPIPIECYTTTRGDTPTLDKRVTINCAAYTLTMRDYWILKNLIITGTANEVLTKNVNVPAILINCKITNTSTTANRSAVSGRWFNLYGCELVSTNGYGINTNVGNMFIFNCYFHDSVKGINAASDLVAIGCVFDTLSNTGMDINDAQIMFNVFYNCTTYGIRESGTQGNSSFINHNVFHTCGTGVSFSVSNLISFLNNNCYYNNSTANVGGIDIGTDNIFANPLFVDAPNGNFTLQSGSPLINAGFDFSKIGLTGSYKWNIGLDQDDNTSGGGGASSYAWAS
jgi:hypothetical protein